MKEVLKWCAIGDSFTYLNDHLEETDFRVEKGYLTHTEEKLEFPVQIVNLGINGSGTCDWLEQKLVKADLYTILLGTNDWFSKHIPLGDELSFQEKKPGSILGNLGYIINRIRQLDALAPIVVMNPVERGDFVYIFDRTNNAHGSYEPENGLWLAEVSKEIYRVVQGEEIYKIDLHGRSGFTPQNAVHFKRLNVNGKMLDVPYPDYTTLPYDPKQEEYPYPKEAIDMTYDGLHPSDEGNEILATLLANELNSIFKNK